MKRVYLKFLGPNDEVVMAFTSREHLTRRSLEQIWTNIWTKAGTYDPEKLWKIEKAAAEEGLIPIEVVIT